MADRAPRFLGTVAGFLKESGDLAPLVLQAERLRDLQQELDHCIGAAAAPQCRVTSLRQGTVTIRASQNALAARLKVSTPTILRHFQQRVRDVKGLRVEVQFLAPAMSGRTASSRNVISPPAAPLNALAATLPASRLRDAVEALARKGR